MKKTTGKTWITSPTYPLNKGDSQDNIHCVTNIEY